eukprot:gene6759-7469_t
MANNSSPVVEVGDTLRIHLPNNDGKKGEEGGKTQRVIVDVVSIKDKKRPIMYSLKLPNGEILKTTLQDLKWKIKSPSVPKILRKRKQFLNRFPVESLQKILAPMVGASELPFRLLCRRYGATLAYTPMMNAERFAIDADYRKEEFQVIPEDRPLVAHFAANQPQTLLAAAKLIENQCDAIDLNLGCPQRVACAGHFGSFLLDPQDRPLVLSIIRTLSEGLTIPIFAKIRLLDKFEDTVELVQQLYEAGASVIAIHGRYRVNLTQRSGPGARDGPAHLDQIARICQTFPHIPIIANGNVRTLEDVSNNLEMTQAYGIMSAEGLLDNPALFSGKMVKKTVLAEEYLALAEEYPVKVKSIIFHIRRILKDELTQYQLLEDCISAPDLMAVKEIVQKVILYETQPNQFHFDREKALKEKEMLERRKAEEGKRKEYEARMLRKAKREGKDPTFYLLDGAEIPTEEVIGKLKAMNKEEAFQYWKDHHKQHCWSYHFDPKGCPRDRKCAFLHADARHAEIEVYG